MRNKNTKKKENLDEGRRNFIGAALVAVPGATVVSSGLLASSEASAENKGAGPAKEPMVIGYPNKKGIQIERVTYRKLTAVNCRASRPMA